MFYTVKKDRTDETTAGGHTAAAATNAATDVVPDVISKLSEHYGSKFDTRNATSPIEP